MSRRIKIYDTTLRDGTQGEGVTFSMEDKVRIARRLDEFGVHYIEGGWPGSNPKDVRFFERMKEVPLRRAKLAAFGSTRRPHTAASADSNLRRLVESGASVATIFGKTWDFQVLEVLNASLEENLAMISDSVGFLKPRFEEVVYDAEHFFDGFKSNREYALRTLRAAEEAGASCLVLCDTNGGTLPHEVVEIIREVRRHVRAPLGIHVHNDGECAVANSLAAVLEGVDHVQGTINGYGERCGNANLCSIIPNIMLKLGLPCLPEGSLAQLRDVSRFVSELANRPPWQHQPYVGDSAFAHKGGAHVAAVSKHPQTYEHVNPELVGNHRRVLVSELSGQSNVLWKAAQYGIDLSKNTPETRQILQLLKELEDQGYEFEGAEGSFELLMEKALGRHRGSFELEGWRVVVEKRGDAAPAAEATIKLKVNGIPEHAAAEGNGPVSALDNALRKALDAFYPTLKTMSLRDYKVRILEGTQGTSAKTRVLIASGDGHETWGTVGVSHNIIEASWQALVDSIEYKLRLDRKRAARTPEGASTGNPRKA
ncbi:MAG TPA: citramalate synthase [Planctomycetota bacterium]|nr:citramalate synthase [Planctomycetota bacterium]